MADWKYDKELSYDASKSTTFALALDVYLSHALARFIRSVSRFNASFNLIDYIRRINRAVNMLHIFYTFSRTQHSKFNNNKFHVHQCQAQIEI